MTTTTDRLTFPPVSPMIAAGSRFLIEQIAAPPAQAGFLRRKVVSRVRTGPRSLLPVGSAQVRTHVAAKSMLDANAHTWVDVEVIEL
jgi:hypothetical protein